MKEHTLILLKPDAVQRALIGEIISRIEKVGLKIIGIKMVYADKELAGKHYADDEEWLLDVGTKTKISYAEKGSPLDRSALDIGRDIRKQLMDFISMSPVVALCIEGHNAVKTVRKLVGETSPETSLPGTIRGDFAHETYELADGLGRPIQNLIHASGNKADADREIKVWFDESELHHYYRIDEPLLYRDAKGGN